MTKIAEVGGGGGWGMKFLGLKHKSRNTLGDKFHQDVVAIRTCSNDKSLREY